MKRFLTCLLTLVTLLTLAIPASADILWEPYGNRFYESHRADCQYLGRKFYANGGEGFITLWDAPNGSSVAAQYENGEQLWVYYLYEDWGCVSHWADGEEMIGWVPMADMELVYDYISFSEDYADQIAPYGGEFAHYDGDAAGAAFYEYPGAPTVKTFMAFDDSWGNVRQNLTGTDADGSYISSVFVDEQGRTWGFVGYMYGRLNGWFCLDDPEGDGDPEKAAEQAEPAFPRREVGKAELKPAREPRFPVKGYIPYILVGSVVVVTAVIMAVFFKKKKRA